MKSKFKILFSIEVLHEFFRTGRWKHFWIFPTPETENLFKQNEIITRKIDNELLVIAKTDDTGKLYQTPNLFTCFSFILIPQSTGYLNFTNLPISSLNTGIYNFNNLNGNEAGGRHYITKSINNYDNSKSYQPGEFVKAPNGKIYEAVAINNGGAGSIEPNDTPAAKNVWVTRGDSQFANGADATESYSDKEYMLELANGYCHFKTSVKKKAHTVEIYAFQKESLQYNQEISHFRVSFDDVSDEVPIDLRYLSSGKYRIRVNDDIKFIYHVTAMNYNGLPMFADIFHLPADHPQSFLDADQKPKRKKFTVAFAARRVLWRYKTRTDIIKQIEDTDGESNYSFKPDGLRKFISHQPIPFSETAITTFVAKSGSLKITSPLPNPQADKLLEKQNGIYTTEAFINF